MRLLKTVTVLLILFSFQIGASAFAGSLKTADSNTLSASYTWISGSNKTNQPGSYGVKGIPSPQNVPSSRYLSTSWTDSSGYLWLFGGLDYRWTSTANIVYSNDLWRYDPRANEWTWVSGSNTLNQPSVYGIQGVASPTNIPGARSDVCRWVDSSGSLWLFGGSGYNGTLNDLWKYNPSTNEWTWIHGSNTNGQPGVYGRQGAASPTNVPGARSGSVSWTDSLGNLWLFGGWGTTTTALQYGSLNDLWKYDPNTNQWTWMSGSDTTAQNGSYGTKGVASSTNGPGARQNSISWTDSAGNLWLFGGIGYGYMMNGNLGYLNDLWKYDTHSSKWTWISGSNTINQPGVYGTQGLGSPKNVPGGRRYSVSWTDSLGNFWLLGGSGYATANSAGALNDLWKYDPRTNEWTWTSGSLYANAGGVYGTQGLSSPTNIAGARYGSISWIDSYNNVWLFGGELPNPPIGHVSFLNDLWKINITSTL